jgi:uncharacterized protein Yka (UPF0111/DUF47 family)
MSRTPETVLDLEKKLAIAKDSRAKYSKRIRTLTKKLWKFEDQVDYYQDKLVKMLEKTLPVD